jgi:hypothetical protein
MIKSRLRRKYSKYKSSSLAKEDTKSRSNSTNDILGTRTITAPLPVHDNTRKNGGRPLGTDKDSLTHIQLCAYEAKSEILDLYKQAKDDSMKSGLKRVRKGTFQKIHDDVKKKRNLPESFSFKFTAARKRLSNDTILDNNNNNKNIYML